MENVGKKQEGEPKSTPSAPSTAIDRGSRTIYKFYTRRTKRIHRDPDTSTSTPPPPPDLFSQQEEEKTYYVSWDDYHDWPGFFEDLRKAISEGFFDDIMIDPEKGPDKKVEEKLPDTGISETRSNEFVTTDEPLNSAKNRTEFENSQSYDAGYIPYENASTPQGTQSSVITGVGTSDIDNRTSGADYFSMDRTTGVGTSDIDNRTSGADYISMDRTNAGPCSTEGVYIPYKNASVHQVTQPSDHSTAIRTSDIDNSSSISKPWGRRDIRTNEIEEYVEKSGIYGSIPAGTETIGQREEELMHYGTVPGMDTVSEGLQEDAAEVPKQELPVEFSGKELDTFHNMKMNQ